MVSIFRVLLSVGAVSLSIASFSDSIMLRVCGSRTLTDVESSLIVGGDFNNSNESCSVVASTPCPSGAPPVPEVECSTQTAVGCLAANCTTCDAAPGTNHKSCFSIPYYTCDPSTGGDWGSSVCGTHQYRGCQSVAVGVGFPPTYTLTCSCPGAPYATSSWYDCVAADCTQGGYFD
ncbi:MAG: hypothetical protein KDA80_05525 [Planctomycetaceae bacterium]|nr:hypothetical protein [Planctomycetaceae bacterium]